jgi:hypothetical protein
MQAIQPAYNPEVVEPLAPPESYSVEPVPITYDPNQLAQPFPQYTLPPVQLHYYPQQISAESYTPPQILPQQLQASQRPSMPHLHQLQQFNAHPAPQQQQKGGLISSIKNVVNSVRGCGSITIFLNKPCYIAGERVTGRAELNITEKVLARTLMIQWRGYERAKREHTAKKQDIKTHSMNEKKPTVHSGKVHEIFTQTVTLNNFGGSTIVPGNYTFDFEYQLPNTLPGVFSRRSKSFVSFATYEVKVWVDMQGIDIKRVNSFNVCEAITRIPQPINTQDQKTVFMGGDGALHMIVSTVKDIYMPGERVIINCNIVNDTKRDVSAIEVKLEQHVLVNTGEMMKEIITLNLLALPGVKSMSAFVGDVLYDIPADVYPSMNGTIVTNQYKLAVQCKVPLAKDLIARSNITIAQGMLM